mgnify:FL=1
MRFFSIDKIQKIEDLQMRIMSKKKSIFLLLLIIIVILLIPSGIWSEL